MAEMLTWLWLYILTNLINWISKKFNATIDKGWIIAMLSLMVGLVYYMLQSYYPDWLQKAATFLAGSFATSQGIRLVLNNLLVPREDTLSK